ncbi:MAG: hypothetical protein JSS61_02395 [Verrucomicrobia bacterium]|nr:hypothetical protein [Verrucomicrobiota bacterium]
MTAAISRIPAQSRPLPHLGPWGMLNGIFWMGMLVVNLFGMVEDGIALKQACHDDLCTQRWGGLLESTQKAFESSVAAVGSGAAALQWTHEVEWVDLGKAFSIVKGLVYGSALVNAIARTASLSLDLWAARQSGASKTEQVKLNLIRLAASVTMAAWGVLGIASLIAAVPFYTGLSLALLTVSLVFSIAAWRYKRECRDKNIL